MTSLTDAITNILSSYQGVTTLFLEDIVRSVDIGVHEYEIGNPQLVRFDIYVLISGVKDPENDIIEDVLNYEYLLNSLEKVLLKPGKCIYFWNWRNICLLCYLLRSHLFIN